MVEAAADPIVAVAGNHAGLKVLATKADFDRSLSHHPVVIVDFTATWCGPCKTIAPKFEELATKYPTVAFRKVDIDQNGETARDAGVNSYPTFIVYKNGKKRDELKGANPTALEDLIRKHAGGHGGGGGGHTMARPSSAPVFPTIVATSFAPTLRPLAPLPNPPGAPAVLATPVTAGAGVKYLKTKADFDKSLSHHSVVIVDFTAKWCGPCKTIAPKFEAFATKYPTVAFRKVDVDDNAATAQAVGVTSMPTFIVYKRGQRREELSGSDAVALEELIKKYAGSVPAIPAVHRDHSPVPQSPAVTPLVKHLKTKADLDLSVLHHPVVIVDFTASWCGPCKTIAPKFDDLATKYPTVAFRKVDVDDNPEAAKGITATPTFVVYQKGHRREEVTTADPSKLEDLVKKYGEGIFSPLSPPRQHVAPTGVKHLNTKADFDKSLSHHPVVIVDFTAKWCGPCKTIAPKFEELATKYPTVAFRKVDVDDNAETAQAMSVNSMPTFIVYKRGQRREELGGADPTALEELIKKYA